MRLLSGMYVEGRAMELLLHAGIDRDGAGRNQGHLLVLCNVMMFDRGHDDPVLYCCVVYCRRLYVSRSQVAWCLVLGAFVASTFGYIGKINPYRDPDSNTNPESARGKSIVHCS